MLPGVGIEFAAQSLRKTHINVPSDRVYFGTGGRERGNAAFWIENVTFLEWVSSGLETEVWRGAYIQSLFIVCTGRIVVVIVVVVVKLFRV